MEAIKEIKKDYNIILILLDGTRLDRLERMKNFHELAGRGTFFSKMITYGAQTVMSMHAIFTGIYGNINGADNYFGSVLFKKNHCKTLASYLKEAGFYTKGDTLNEIVAPPQGFDELLIHDEGKDNLTERHKNFLKEMRDKKQKFFLYLHYSNVHTGMVKTVLKKYKDFNKEYFSRKPQNTENYDKFINEADIYLRDIYAECKKLGLVENSVIIIMSDHGASIGDKIGEIGYGRYCYDYTMRTFAIFLQEDIFPKKNITKLCRTVDITPTILDLCNIKTDNSYIKPHGETLFNLFTDERDNRHAYSESAGLVDPYPTKEKPRLKAIRTDTWKLIHDVKTNNQELYNLKEDPLEENNLITEQQEKAQELFNELKAVNQTIT